MTRAYARWRRKVQRRHCAEELQELVGGYWAPCECEGEAGFEDLPEKAQRRRQRKERRERWARRWVHDDFRK